MPLELIHRILKDLRDDQAQLDLANARLVCRSWFLIATPLLYQHMTVTAQQLADLLKPYDAKALDDGLKVYEAPKQEPDDGQEEEAGTGRTAGQVDPTPEEDHPIDWPWGKRLKWTIDHVEHITYRPTHMLDSDEGVRPMTFRATQARLHARQQTTMPRLRAISIDMSLVVPAPMPDGGPVFDGPNHVTPLVDMLGKHLKPLHLCYRLHEPYSDEYTASHYVQDDLDVIKGLNAVHVVLHDYTWEHSVPDLTAETLVIAHEPYENESPGELQHRVGSLISALRYRHRDRTPASFEIARLVQDRPDAEQEQQDFERLLRLLLSDSRDYMDDETCVTCGQAFPPAQSVKALFV